MQGDFSRFTFDPSKHYERVLVQQGRVQLDADWNEQQEILSHRLETETLDLIGPSGAPEHDAGFKISPYYALEFDGVDDYILFSAPAAHVRTRYPSFTIELRVHARSHDRAGTLISSLGFGEAGEYSLMIEDDRTLTFRMFEGQVGTPVMPPERSGERSAELAPDIQVVDIHTRRAIPTDTFCHIAVTVTSGDAVIYVDGQIAARREFQDKHYRARLPLVIGASIPHGRGADHFGGIIEEVRFWSVVRTREEIWAYRDRTVAGTPHALIGYWPLDEGKGTTVRDRTGRGNDGLLGGGIHECIPRWTFRDLAIGAGRYYVHGTLCENEQTALFTSQPDDPGVALPSLSESGWFLVYLDVWKRHLTAIEAPSVREVGLGGPDTTTRLKTVWQARLLPVEVAGERLDDAVLFGTWDEFLRQANATGMLRARRVPAAPGLGNLLYRIEIHDGNRGTAPSIHQTEPEVVTARVVKFFPSTNEVSISPWTLAGVPWEIGQVVAFFDDRASGDPGPLHLATVVDVDDGRQVLGLDAIPPENVRGTAIYLQRVATFKWSRENGSIAFPVQKVDPTGAVVTLGQSGHDCTTLRPGDLVELTDDTRVLQQRSGSLALVSSVDYSRREVLLASPLVDDVGRDPTTHPVLRRWDHGASGECPMRRALAATGPGWITLENGIQVGFEEHGQYRAGDYWLIPARSATEDIEWPRDGRGPISRSPDGIRHRYCLLAAVRFHMGHVHVRDLRRTFASLTAFQSSPDGHHANGHDSNGQDAPDWPVDRHNGHPIETVGSPVPPGFSILGSTPNPPHNYAYTGLSLLLFKSQKRTMVPMRNLGRLHCAVVNDRILLIADSGEVWEFDPQTLQVEHRAYLRPTRYGFGIAVAQGRLFAFGGVDLDGRLTDRTSEYEPSSDRWVTRMPMRSPRSHLAAASVHGKVYAMGGETRSWLGRRASNLNEEYDPERDRWCEWRPMPTSRSSLATAAVDGTIYAIGGEQRSRLPWLGPRKLRTTEQYHPKRDTWQRLAALPTPRSRLAVAQLNGKLYATGGALPAQHPHAPRGSDAIEEYDPSIDCWTSKGTIALPRHLFGLVSIHHEIYAIGKESSDETSAIVESIGASLYIHRSVSAIASPVVMEEFANV